MRLTLVSLRHGRAAEPGRDEPRRGSSACSAQPPHGAPVSRYMIAAGCRHGALTSLIWAIVRRLVPPVRLWRWGWGRRPTPVKAMPARLSRPGGPAWRAAGMPGLRRPLRAAGPCQFPELAGPGPAGASGSL